MKGFPYIQQKMYSFVTFTHWYCSTDIQQFLHSIIFQAFERKNASIFLHFFLWAKYVPFSNSRLIFQFFHDFLLGPRCSLPKDSSCEQSLKIFRRAEYVSPDSVKSGKSSVHRILCTSRFCLGSSQKNGAVFLQPSFFSHWKEMKTCIYIVIDCSNSSVYQWKSNTSWRHRLITVPGNGLHSVLHLLTVQLRWKSALTY